MRRYKTFDLVFIFGSFVFFAGLVLMLFNFLNGIGYYSYLLLVNDGTVFRKVTSRYLYNVNLRGMIIAFSFLISTVSMFLFVVYSVLTMKKPKNTRKIEQVNHLVPGSNKTQVEQDDTEEQLQGSEQAIPESDSSDSGQLMPTEASSNNVLYGDGEIDEEGMHEFVKSFPDTAIKFAFEINVNGTNLSDGTKELYHKWSTRGLNKVEVKQEIQRILGWEVLEKERIREISVELKKKIENKH